MSPCRRTLSTRHRCSSKVRRRNTRTDTALAWWWKPLHSSVTIDFGRPFTDADADVCMTVLQDLGLRRVAVRRAFGGYAMLLVEFWLTLGCRVTMSLPDDDGDAPVSLDPYMNLARSFQLVEEKDLAERLEEAAFRIFATTRAASMDCDGFEDGVFWATERESKRARFELCELTDPEEEDLLRWVRKYGAALGLFERDRDVFLRAPAGDRIAVATEDLFLGKEMKYVRTATPGLLARRAKAARQAKLIAWESASGSLEAIEQRLGPADYKVVDDDLMLGSMFPDPDWSEGGRVDVRGILVYWNAVPGSAALFKAYSDWVLGFAFPLLDPG